MIGLMFDFAGAANGTKGRLTHLHSTGENLPSSVQGLVLGLVCQAAMAQMVTTLTLGCVRKKVSQIYFRLLVCCMSAATFYFAIKINEQISNNFFGRFLLAEVCFSSQANTAELHFTTLFRDTPLCYVQRTK